MGRPGETWSYVYSSDKWAILDHVLMRGGRPLAGDVSSFGVSAIEDEVARIEANFRNTGSDHFPLWATATLGS